MAHFKGSPCRNAQVVFFHTWCFSWHAIKYLLNLSTDSNWYSIFVYQIKFYFDIALVLLPPLCCPHKCHKCWWHRFNKLPKKQTKKKRSSEASVHTNTTASGTSGRFMGWCKAALRFSLIPQEVHRIEMEAIWVHCHVQETTLRGLELCDTTRYPVGSSHQETHQETVHGGHKGMDVVRSKTQVACRVWAMLACY